jgi:malonate-semialdehyde dehydrogenase (acetylating) / methylmalonate-semialdehyde dehydrogenase
MATVAVQGHWVGGRDWRGNPRGKSRGVSGTPVAIASADDATYAVDAALAAYRGWAAVPTPDRGALFTRYRELVAARQGDFVLMLESESGLSRAEARGAFARGMDMLGFVAKLELALQWGVEGAGTAVRQPIGVGVALTPAARAFEAPLWMFPVAVASGNTFILKPSPRAPSVPLLLARLFCEAGAPPGVLNVLFGDAQTGRDLIADRRVGGVGFLGDTLAADDVYTFAIAHGKLVQSLDSGRCSWLTPPRSVLYTPWSPW